MSPFALRKVAKLYIANSYAAKAEYLEMYLLAHFSYLSVSALVKSHAENAGVASVGGYLHLYRLDLVVVDDHRLAKLLDLFLVAAALDLDVIYLGDLVLGVCKHVGKLAVVGEEQKTVGIHIKSSYGIYSLSNVCDKLGDALSASVVGHGGDITAGLVEHNVGEFFILAFSGHYSLALVLNYVFFRVYLLTQSGDLAVDLNSTRLDLCLCGAS